MRSGKIKFRILYYEFPKAELAHTIILEAQKARYMNSIAKIYILFSSLFQLRCAVLVCSFYIIVESKNLKDSLI